MQPLRVVPFVRRGPLAQHPRARRRLEQLRGGHPLAHRAGAHPSAVGALLGLHHRRGAHALGRGVQRLPQDARRAARPCRVHPGHHRETQDHPHDPLALPGLRLQPHTRGGRRGLSALHRRRGGRCCGRRVAEPHRPQGRRRHARRAVDVRQGRVVLRRRPPLQGGRAHAQRTRLRYLFYDYRPVARGRLRAGAPRLRRGPLERLLGPDLHGGPEPPPA